MRNYYKEYLKNHYNPKCRLMHFIGQWITILFFIYILTYKNWLLLPFVPFIIYPFAISGHILFQKKGNKPSFYKMSLIKAKIADWRMFLDIMRGKISIW